MAWKLALACRLAKALEPLTEKLGTRQPQVIVGDHTLTRDYFAAVCA